jgi:hypothetical protein
MMKPLWRVGAPMIALEHLEIETLIGYLGELLDSNDTPDKDISVLSVVYGKLVERLGE